MLKPRPYWWGLLLVGLVLSGVITVATSLLGNENDRPWAVSAVEVVDRQGGEVQLRVRGEGVHKGLKALLLPEMTAAGSADRAAALSVPLYHFATDGRRAVATSRDQRLLTLDVTEGLRPTVLGGVKLSPPGSNGGHLGMTSVLLIGSKAVVSMSPEGVALVDVADPAEPRQVDFLPIREHLLEMEAVGERIYVASRTAGLFAVTLEGNRLLPLHVPDSRLAARLTAAHGRLVTASYRGVLTFYDLDGAGRPHRAGTLDLATDIRDLVLARENLYVATAAGKILEFNLDAWPRPVLAGELDLKGRPLKLERNESARQLYCILVGSGVDVIDISRTGQPQSAASIALAKEPFTVRGFDQRLFMAGLNGLTVLPADGPGDDGGSASIEYPLPSSSGGCSLLEWNSAIFAYNQSDLRMLSEGRAVSTQTENIPFLVLPDRAGVRLHPIRDGVPGTEIIGRIPVYDEAATKRFVPGLVIPVRRVFWQSGRIYALSPAKVSIFAVDRSGRVLSREEIGFQEGLLDMAGLSDGFLVLATDAPALRVVDVRQPGAYRVIGDYPFPKFQKKVGAVKALLVDGHRLYVARARLGVEVYDLADPVTPKLLQRIDTPGVASDLSLYDGLLLIADNDSGLFVVDVSSKRAVAAGTFQTPNPCKEILCSESGTYLSNSSPGYRKFLPPVRLSSPVPVSAGLAELTVPADTTPGRYRLALYDGKVATSYAVTLK